MSSLLYLGLGIALGFVMSVLVSLAMQPRGRPFGDDPEK
jgi:hypothetical protein